MGPCPVAIRLALPPNLLASRTAAVHDPPCAPRRSALRAPTNLKVDMSSAERAVNWEAGPGTIGCGDSDVVYVVVIRKQEGQPGKKQTTGAGAPMCV